MESSASGSSASPTAERTAAEDTAEERTTGSDDPTATRLHDVEQPDLRGTLFLTTIFLMMIFGFWALMYFELLGR